MGKRKSASSASTCDEDDNTLVALRRSQRFNVSSKQTKQEETPTEVRVESVTDEECEEEESDEEKKEQEEPKEVKGFAKPIGVVVRVSGKAKKRKNHYQSFECMEYRYEVGDSVLLVPEDIMEGKPYVGIIKDIIHSEGSCLMVDVQWFYRPEDIENSGGGTCQSCDLRKLFYSFYRSDYPADRVLHKCVVHFVPSHMQIANCRLPPGFIVQKVYDTDEQDFWNLRDLRYEDSEQQEIDLLVQKTLSRLEDLADIETKECKALTRTEG